MAWMEDGGVSLAAVSRVSCGCGRGSWASVDAVVGPGEDPEVPVVAACACAWWSALIKMERQWWRWGDGAGEKVSRCASRLQGRVDDGKGRFDRLLHPPRAL